MDAQQLRDWIDSLTDDIEFMYQGKWGSICPFSRENISLCWDGDERTVASVDAAMREPFLDGHSLAECSEQLRFGNDG